jgi:hypothetical protein
MNKHVPLITFNEKGYFTEDKQIVKLMQNGDIESAKLRDLLIEYTSRINELEAKLEDNAGVMLHLNEIIDNLQAHKEDYDN